MRLGHEKVNRGRRGTGLFLVLVLLASLPTAAQEETACTVTLTCEAAPELLPQLAPLSVELARDPATVTTPQRLRRRGDRDAARLTDALRALGYLEARVTVTVTADTPPWSLTLAAAPGPRYVLGAVSVEALDPAGDAVPTPAALELGLAEGAPALSAALRAAEKALHTHYRRTGFPFPSVEEVRFVADPARQVVEPAFRVATGPRAALGEVTVTGLEAVRPEVVLREVPWPPGAAYDERLLGEYRNRLYRLGLFAVVRVRGSEALGEDGVLGVTVEVEEGKHRTIRTGLTFHSTDGPGMSAAWEDRNQRGLGHTLRLGATLGTQRSDLRAGYELPRFRRPDQQLSLSFNSGLEDTDAYASTYARTEAWVVRRPSARLRLGAGLALRYSLVDSHRRDDGSEDYTLLSTPFEAGWDARDDVVHPTAGWRVAGRVEPFLDVTGLERNFLKLEGTFAWYRALDRDADWVAAARLRLAGLAGVALGDVPDDLRYYAGGGGSVRGYAHQRVGPMDDDDDPVGGRSLVEAGLELRRRLTESLGLVFFADGGSVESDIVPTFSGRFQWGAGAGLRYLTPLGAMRFDAAVPLDKRGEDRAFQIYISLGHAF